MSLRRLSLASLLLAAALAFGGILWSAEISRENRSVDNDVVALQGAESLVSAALLSQMDVWPPASLCNSNMSRPFVSLVKIRKEVKKLYLGLKEETSVSMLSLHLLRRAVLWNKTLLTLQIGAGGDELMQLERSNKQETARQQHHWMPVIAVEPSDDPLTGDSYLGDIKPSCFVSEKYAVYYDQDGRSHGQSVCDFCQFDSSRNLSSRCDEQINWMQSQVGLVTCRKFSSAAVKECFVRSTAKCGTALDFLRHHKLLGSDETTATRIAMLQISQKSTKAAEDMLNKLMQEFEEQQVDLPPAIHYQATSDRQNSSNHSVSLREKLEAKGYTIIQQHHFSILAIQLSRPRPLTPR